MEQDEYLVILPFHVAMVVIVEMVHVHQDPNAKGNARGDRRAGRGPYPTSNCAGNNGVAQWTHIRLDEPLSSV